MGADAVRDLLNRLKILDEVVLRACDTKLLMKLLNKESQKHLKD